MRRLASSLNCRRQSQFWRHNLEGTLRSSKFYREHNILGLLALNTVRFANIWNKYCMFRKYLEGRTLQRTLFYRTVSSAYSVMFEVISVLAVDNRGLQSAA